MLNHISEHSTIYATAFMGSGATAATEVLPDGFFQAFSQLLIAAVTVWKILAEGKKDGKKDTKNKQ